MTTLIFNKWYGEGDFARLLLRYQGGRALVVRKQNRKGMTPLVVLSNLDLAEWARFQRIYKPSACPEWYATTPRSPAVVAEIGDI